MASVPWCWLALCLAAALAGTGAKDDAAAGAVFSPRDAEIRIVSPLPDAHFPSGTAVPLHTELVVQGTALGEGTIPAGWALALSLDDAESTSIPGARARGELPALADGHHAILVQLVDDERQGALLGPRALVRFRVGEPPVPPAIRIEEPPARLVWRGGPGESLPAHVVLVSQEGGVPAGHTPRVSINGVDATAQLAPWPSGSAEWTADLGHLPDGLHVLDASLFSPEGLAVAADRRYVQVQTRNASHPRGGLEFAADDATCCRALPDGPAYTAPPIPADISVEAFDEAGWGLEGLRDPGEVLAAYCKMHHRVLQGGQEAPRFLVLDAAGIPLGNRLQFLASGFLLALLTNRVVLVDMGELSMHFESFSMHAVHSSAPSCKWNYASMEEVEIALETAVGDAEWGAGGWAEKEGGKRKELRTQAAVPMAWVEVLACEDLRAWMPEGGVLTMRSNQNFVPFLYSNAHHRSFLYQTFGQDALGVMLRHFVVPAPQVKARLDAIRATADGAFLVGLQLRRRYGTEKDRCKFSIPDPARGGFQRTYSHYSHAREELLVSCAAALARAQGAKVRFYVSSDTPEEVGEAVSEALGWRRLLDKGAAFYVDTGGQGIQDRRLVDEILSGGVGDYRSSNASGLRAVLDMWMLASADDLVITPSSTYGMMAAALHGGSAELGRSGPVFPTKWGKCARMVAKQPASHSWLRVRRASCFRPEMLAPEFDMLCPDCTLWECGCDGANPCASHTERGSSLEDPRYTAHLPL